MHATTPLMKQFLAIKAEHPETILFFRVGDFYEMFYDDAVKASKILQITLTSRDKNNKNPIPLCGIPHHASSAYIARLIRAGESVALCEQVEDAASVKGIVRREVMRVITPGTVIEAELLSEKEANYLVALHWKSHQPLETTRKIGLSCIDLSTGDFRILATDGTWEMIEAELMKIAPKEIVLSSRHQGKMENIHVLTDRWPLRFVPTCMFTPEETEDILKSHFRVQTLVVFGGDPFSLVAAGTLLLHLKDTQKQSLDNITALRPIPTQNLMRIHPLALKHLDLLPLSQEQHGGTLFHLLDHTLTAMGGRLLKESILRPLLLVAAIKERQAGVAFFYEYLTLRTKLRDLLKQVADIERLIARISLRATQPRDLIALKTSIDRLPQIATVLSHLENTTAGAVHPALIAGILNTWDNIESVSKLIALSIVPEPPFSLKDGGVIRPGYLAELDTLRNFQKEGRSMLTEIEKRERQRTGIDSLKVRYNQVQGYYIEVSKTQVKNVPDDYMRKQTLANAERFMTAELKTLEEKLAGAKDAILTLENQIFEEIRYDVAQESARIQAMAKTIALLDLLSALAEIAHHNHYCRPEINDDQTIRIIEGRHPVLEAGMSGGKTGFVPNDTLIDPPTTQLMILTGPNMAGKSTYMQQIALIVLLAQMGSYVPAREATIGVCDQIFTRVGAQDALNAGMSTFMVEMTEMAQILMHATDKSLILLDEIGRGTSTFDGISIAWAIAEHVYTRLKARTLFATHYHELTGLAVNHKGIRNYHVLVREWGDEIVFLRKMVEGGSDKSYGIQVGRLAGLPPTIIKRAKSVLKKLETQATQTPLYAHIASQTQTQVAEQPSLFTQASNTAEEKPLPEMPEETHPLIATLQKIDPLHLTPMQALQVLSDLSEQAKKSDKPHAADPQS